MSDMCAVCERMPIRESCQHCEAAVCVTCAVYHECADFTSNGSYPICAECMYPVDPPWMEHDEDCSKFEESKKYRVLTNPPRFVG